MANGVLPAQTLGARQNGANKFAGYLAKKHKQSCEIVRSTCPRNFLPQDLEVFLYRACAVGEEVDRYSAGPLREHIAHQRGPVCPQGMPLASQSPDQRTCSAPSIFYASFSVIRLLRLTHPCEHPVHVWYREKVSFWGKASKSLAVQQTSNSAH